jgi:hypothetical protein
LFTPPILYHSHLSFSYYPPLQFLQRELLLLGKDKLLLTFLVKFCATELARNFASVPCDATRTEQNPVVSWERCTVWIHNDPSVVRLPPWSGQFLTMNNTFFPRSIRSVVRSTGRKPEKNPVTEARCVCQAGRGRHYYYYVYYYFYYNLALGAALALEKLCCSLERRFSIRCLQHGVIPRPFRCSDSALVHSRKQITVVRINIQPQKMRFRQWKSAVVRGAPRLFRYRFPFADEVSL